MQHLVTSLLRESVIPTTSAKKQPSRSVPCRYPAAVEEKRKCTEEKNKKIAASVSLDFFGDAGKTPGA